ncbi:MAG: toprim domain-containing protein, partial [Planctomycetota bacterium]
MTTHTPDQLLKARGLLEVAQVAQWQPCEASGAPGWSYPVYNANAQPYTKRRWKACNGTKPKYRWLWEKPDKVKYYFLPGTFAEIANTSGNCWLAGGEPDVLAFNAAGIKNVICWLDGEGSPPTTLANDLAHMGVTVLLYAPDRDHQGMVSAHKVRQLLDGTGIELLLFELPGEVDSKFDIGDLWIAAEFNPKTFKTKLDGLGALDAVDAFLHAQQKPSAKPASEDIAELIKRWRKEWAKSIRDAMGTPVKVENGNERWHCPFPGHEDRDPSFRFSTDKNPAFPWPMCSCGIQEHKDAYEQLAAVLNIDEWPVFKALKAAEEGYTRAPKTTTPLSRAPEGTPQVKKWSEMDRTFGTLQSELRGEFVPEIYPMVAPLQSLHKFGGFARITRRKKLTCIAGVSGGGKTLLMMTMAITQLKNGYDVIWWGPEWDPYEYAEQHLQRNEGCLTMDQLDEWRLWNYYEQKGTIKEMSAKYGLVKPPQALIDKSIAAIDTMLAWPGKMYFLDPYFKMEHKQVLDTAYELTMIKRAEGRDVAEFDFDYIQLAQARGKKDWTWA